MVLHRCCHHHHPFIADMADLSWYFLKHIVSGSHFQLIKMVTFAILGVGFNLGGMGEEDKWKERWKVEKQVRSES